jgi:hypothetical protein
MEAPSQSTFFLFKNFRESHNSPLESRNVEVYFKITRVSLDFQALIVKNPNLTKNELGTDLLNAY